MLDAAEPIYDFLFEYLRDQFLHDEPGDNKPLKRFERGIIFDTVRNVNAKAYPMGYLEWGEVSEIEPYQSPNGFKYDLIYSLVLLTFQQEGKPENAVFTNATDRGLYGIGDLVTKVMRELWQTHHGGRLEPAGHGGNRGEDWWIINWTFSVGERVPSQPGEVDEIQAGSVRRNRSNPLVRGTEINLKFSVFERDPL